MTLGAWPQCRSRGLLAQDRAVLLCRPRRERRGLRVCGQTRGVRRFGTCRRTYHGAARPWPHLPPEWAHSPMIRPKLVTQIRASQPPDQDEYARRSRKRHLPVQVRSKHCTEDMQRFLPSKIVDRWENLFVEMSR